ncbi:MAG TPA: hypothetical protein VK895_00960 [Jiangellaceae bacterium]|nr:hypothetical protein [Jiangellaceae bacterium]
MCESNRNLEEILTHGLIGVMGVNHDQFNSWATGYFQITNDSWHPWGTFDPNDKSRPFGKTLNAAFLMTYALLDDVNKQWHSREDYYAAASGQNNRFHGHNYKRRLVRNQPEARAYSNRIDMFCPLFAPGNISNFPSHRAGVMIHEGWHLWQRKNNFDSAHPTGGASTWSQGDYFYFHRVSKFRFGDLHRYNTSPSDMRFHSPYQIEAEFFADLAELARPQVPNIVSQTARSHGNILLANAFVNATAYRIGNPRPW